MNKAEEKKIITLLQQDHKSAVKELFDQYHALLCQVSYNILQDQDEAKDVVQEVFFKLWRNRKSLSIEVSLFAYLKRAVVNTSLNVVEKHKKFGKLELSKVGETHFASENADQQQRVNELSNLAEKAINNLPPRTMAVFRLIRSEEMSYKEVANALEISVKAVEKEMMKALRLLREALKEYLPVLVLVILSKAVKFILHFF